MRYLVISSDCHAGLPNEEYRGYLDPPGVSYLAKRLNLRITDIWEVATFYSMIHIKAIGKYHIQVCTNISCLLVGGEELYEHAKKKLGIGHKEVTPDGRFSLEEVECMGACSWAPAVEINYDFHHFVTPAQLEKLIDDLRRAGTAPSRNVH